MYQNVSFIFALHKKANLKIKPIGRGCMAAAVSHWRSTRTITLLVKYKHNYLGKMDKLNN